MLGEAGELVEGVETTDGLRYVFRGPVTINQRKVNKYRRSRVQKTIEANATFDQFQTGQENPQLVRCDRRELEVYRL